MKSRILETVSAVAAPHVHAIARLHLKTRQLTFLVHLDEQRCLARAAEAAGLTQPAASKLLRQVESSLDVKLFERHARGVEPTGYGEILVRRARQALAELRTARDEIAALKSGLSGHAALGVVFDPKSSLITTAIARMKQRHPGVLVSIEIESSCRLAQRLLQGELDLIVGRLHDADGADDFVYEPLAAEEPHVVVAGAHHPLAGRKALQLRHLVEQAWILPPAGSLVRNKLSGLFAQQGVPLPNNVVETSAAPLINALLQQSTLIAAVAEETVRPSCQAGLLSVLVRNLPLGVAGFGVITRRDHKLSPGAQLMLKMLREAAIQPREKLTVPRLQATEVAA